MGKALLVGHLVVNGPVLIIILVGLIAALVVQGMSVNSLIAIACVFGGIGVAWLWWSYTVPRWRQWAYLHVVDKERLQALAVATGLIWSKGSIFEKTEFKVDDN